MQQNYSQLTTAELVRLAQAGNEKAFAALMKKHTRGIYAVLQRFADVTELDDAVQEVHIRAWKSLKNLRMPSSFPGWLRAAALNQARDQLRKSKLTTLHRMQSLDAEGSFGDDEGLSLMDRLADTEHKRPEESLLRKEQMKMIDEALQKIPSQFREAFVLCDREDLTYEQIALITQTELGTVKSRIARGRRQLKERLEQAERASEEWPRRYESERGEKEKRDEKLGPEN